jgi:hypothetical protein
MAFFISTRDAHISPWANMGWRLIWHVVWKMPYHNLFIIYFNMSFFVLLYIRIMSLNTYNKNVDIIWHYCIISQIKLHGFWKRSAFTNMKKDILKYMINRLWYGIFHTTCHINRLSSYLWKLIVFRNHVAWFGIWCNNVILYLRFYYMYLET